MTGQSSTGSTCQHCAATTSNGLVLCKTCQTTAKVGAENVAAYHRDLLGIGGQVSLVRRATGVSDPTGSAVSATERDDSNAPDVAASETRTALVGWVRALVDDRPQVAMPRDTVDAMTAVLVKRTTTIATLAWAGDYVKDILGLEKRLRLIVQRSKGHWYAGVCLAQLVPERPHDRTSCACSCHLVADSGPAVCDVPGGCGPEFATIPGEYCDRDLYAIPGAADVWCLACRTKHSVQSRRAALLEEARESLLPLGVIAQVCVTLLDGEPSVARLHKRIQKWTERGDLEDLGVRVLEDRRPHRVYRLGDVLDTLIGEVSTARRRTS